MNNQSATVGRGHQLRGPDPKHTDELTESLAGETGKRRPAAERYKIQIQLSERAKDRLFELVEKSGAESAAQVVRDALRIYDILLEETEEKGKDLFLRSGPSGEVVRLRLF